MNIKDLNSIEQLEQFLTRSQSVAFLVASSADESYQGIQRTLVKFIYPSLNKRSKGRTNFLPTSALFFDQIQLFDLFSRPVRLP